VTTSASPTDPLAVQCFLTRPPGGRLRDPALGARAHDHTVRAVLTGQLDRSTSGLLVRDVTAAARNPEMLSTWTDTPAIQLDLSGLSFLDVPGMRALEEARAALLALKCRLCLTFPSPQVLRILDFAVRKGWLSRDLQCEGEFPWPQVVPTVRLSTAAHRRTA
jgi:anti-anti-sigma regulatory factor